MQGNRARDTRPEVAVRSAVHALGLRFRKHVAPLSGLRCRADLVFARQRVAVFVDGCFWHGCPEHGVLPTTNASYWQAKLGGNLDRDRRNDAALAAAGWTVVRVWEHEDPQAAALRVAMAVRATAAESDG
jgi:DNA mismatch endonuclease (patch repair protein)